MDGGAEEIHDQDVEVVFDSVVVALRNGVVVDIGRGVQVLVDLVLNAELAVIVLYLFCLDRHFEVLFHVYCLPNSPERTLP